MRLCDREIYARHGDKIARPSSRGSRYVDYIVLAGGSSVRWCTKASTMLSHTRIPFPSTLYQPILSIYLSLSLFLSRISVPLSCFPTYRFVSFRFANVIVRLRHTLPSFFSPSRFYLPFTSQVHVSLSGSLARFIAALFSFSLSLSLVLLPFFSPFPETSVSPRGRDLRRRVSCVFALLSLSPLCDRTPKKPNGKPSRERETFALDTVRRAIRRIPFDKTKLSTYDVYLSSPSFGEPPWNQGVPFFLRGTSRKVDRRLGYNTRNAKAKESNNKAA